VTAGFGRINDFWFQAADAHTASCMTVMHAFFAMSLNPSREYFVIYPGYWVIIQSA